MLLSAASWWAKRPPSPAWPGMLPLLLLGTLIDGILLAVLGWLVPPRWKSIASLFQKERVMLAGAILVLLLLWIPVVLFAQSATVGGIRYWWLGDDAMISMRYAHNLSSGHGLVWNPGERVEGYTNFLWTITMAVVHLLPVSLARTSLVLSLTNIVIAAATIPVLMQLVRVMGGGRWRPRHRWQGLPSTRASCTGPPPGMRPRCCRSCSSWRQFEFSESRRSINRD